MSRILPKVDVECPEKVEYWFHYQWEDEPLENHFDDDVTVAEIRERMDEGDIFAWFYVTVEAVWGHIVSDPPPSISSGARTETKLTFSLRRLRKASAVKP